MRELLFRGFHPCDGPDTIVVDGEKVKGRWVEGSLIHRTSYYGATGGKCLKGIFLNSETNQTTMNGQAALNLGIQTTDIHGAFRLST